MCKTRATLNGDSRVTLKHLNDVIDLWGAVRVEKRFEKRIKRMRITGGGLQTDQVD